MKNMNDKQENTPQDILSKDPVLETINIKYMPQGGDSNHVIVNGKNIAGILTDFSIHVDAKKMPRLTIGLEPICVEITAKGIISIDKCNVPEHIAFKAYQILKARFEDA